MCFLFKKKEMESKPESLYANQPTIWLHEHQKASEKDSNKKKSKSKKRLASENDDVPDTQAPPPPVIQPSLSSAIKSTHPASHSPQSATSRPPSVRLDTHPNRKTSDQGVLFGREDYMQMNNNFEEEPKENYENFEFNKNEFVNQASGHLDKEDDEESQMDYENAPSKLVVKQSAHNSSDDEDIEDYENTPGINYENVPEKKKKV